MSEGSLNILWSNRTRISIHKNVLVNQDSNVSDKCLSPVRHQAII